MDSRFTKIAIAGVVSTAFGMYAAGEPLAYVTQDGNTKVDETDSRWYQANNSFAKAGTWSDGQVPHSSPETHYYSEKGLGLGYYNEATSASEAWTFGGSSLTVAGRMRPYATEVTVLDFRIMPGAVLSASTAGGVRKLYGGLTLYTTEESPFLVYGSTKDGQLFEFYSTMSGSATAALHVESLGGITGFDILGDATGYYGLISVGTNETLRIGDFGLPNGSVRLLHSSSAMGLRATSGTTVSVKGVAVSSGRLNLDAKSCLSVREMELADGVVLDYSGIGAETAAVGAALVVRESWTQHGRVVIDLSGAMPTFGDSPVDLLVVSNTAGNVNTDLFVIGPNRGVSDYEWVNDGVVTALRLNPAVYNEHTGYVTMLGREADKNVDSFSGVGRWSDGQPPHSTTNYFVSKYFYLKSGTFNGRLFAVQGGVDMRTDTITASDDGVSNPCTINNFKVLGDGVRFALLGGGGTRVFAGQKWFVQTLGDNSLHLEQTSYKEGDVLAKNGESVYVFWTDFYGDSTATIKAGNPLSAVGHEYQPGECEPEVRFLGDMSHYLGKYVMTLNAILRLGDTGLPGTVYADGQHTRLTAQAADGAVVPVGAYVLSNDATVDVPATNSIRVGLLELSGCLTKTGGGTLAVGSATAGAGAALNIVQGAVKPLSKTSMGAAVVTFADNSGVVLDWEPEDREVEEMGLFLGNATVSLAGSLRVRFDFGAQTPIVGRYRKNLVTVRDADAEDIANALEVGKLFRGVAATVGSVSSGGLTTFYVDVEPVGMVLICR